MSDNYFSKIDSVKLTVQITDKNFQNAINIKNVIDFPSYSINADSDLRRTCSVSVYPSDSSYDLKQNGKFWLDKYFTIFIEASGEGEYLYSTNLGYYLIGNPQKVYSPTENKLTFQGIDLMAQLTGLRNGNLEGMSYVVPQGSNVRQVMIDLLAEFGITKYKIEELPITVPNDINIGVGGTAYDILSQLRDLLPNYQMYFDTNGYFCFNKIPSGDDEPITIDDSLWDLILLDYKKSTDYDSVKNSIEVIGRTHEIQHYFENVELENDSYVVRYEEGDVVPNVLMGEKIALYTDKKLVTTNKYFKIYYNSVCQSIFKLFDEEGESPLLDREDKYYVFKVEGHTDNDWTILDIQDLVKTATIEQNLQLLGGNKYLNIYDSRLKPEDIKGGLTYTFQTPPTGCEELTEFNFVLNGVYHPIAVPSLSSGKRYTMDLDPFGDWILNETYTKDARYYIETKIKNNHIVADDPILTDEFLKTNVLTGDFYYEFKIEDDSITSPMVNPYLKVTNTKIPTQANYEITNGIINGLPLENNKTYMVKFNPKHNPNEMFYMEYVGGVTPYAKVQDTKKNSPFSVKSSIGVINKVLCGGEYDNITTDSLAQQRANWELYNYCRINDSVTINTIPNFLSDVNVLTEITLPNGYYDKEDETEKYMIKSINVSGGSQPTQSINMVKYYPFDEDNQVCYGFKVAIGTDLEKDSFNRLTYLEDAIGMTPCHMNYETGVFDYGDWEDAFFMPRPCMLKRSGIVDYYLNPYDYNYKLDGTPSDIHNEHYDGNAMMEWGGKGKNIYIKFEGTPNNVYRDGSVYIANYKKDEGFHNFSFYDKDGNPIDRFYTAIYNGSMIDGRLRSLSNKEVKEEPINDQMDSVTNNGVGYEFEQYSDRMLINMLLILMGKDLDTQAVFGMGVSNGTAPIKTGTMDTKGMFYGTSDGIEGVKVFGMENYWGNAYRTVVGDAMKPYNVVGELTIRRDNFVKMTSSTVDGSLADKYYEVNNGIVSIPNGGGGYISLNNYTAYYGELSQYKRPLHLSYFEKYGMFPTGQAEQRTGNTTISGYGYCDSLLISDWSLCPQSSTQDSFASYGGTYNNGIFNGALCKKYAPIFYSSSTLSYKGYSVDKKITINYFFTNENIISIEYNRGDNCLNPPFQPPYIEGYEFKGWSLTLGGEPLTHFEADTDNITLYAVYVENAPQKDPTYLDNFGVSGGYKTKRVISQQEREDGWELLIDKDIDLTGYKYLDFELDLNSVGIRNLMRPYSIVRGHFYVGFTLKNDPEDWNCASGTSENSAYIQEAIGRGSEGALEKTWISSENKYRIDVSNLDGVYSFHGWLEDSPYGQFAVGITNAVLHN